MNQTTNNITPANSHKEYDKLSNIFLNKTLFNGICDAYQQNYLTIALFTGSIDSRHHETVFHLWKQLMHELKPKEPKEDRLNKVLLTTKNAHDFYNSSFLETLTQGDILIIYHAESFFSRSSSLHDQIKLPSVLHLLWKKGLTGLFILSNSISSIPASFQYNFARIHANFFDKDEDKKTASAVINVNCQTKDAFSNEWITNQIETFDWKTDELITQTIKTTLQQY